MGFLLFTATRCPFIGRIIAHESGLSGNEMAGGVTDRDVGLLYKNHNLYYAVSTCCLSDVPDELRQLAHLASSLE